MAKRDSMRKTKIPPETDTEFDELPAEKVKTSNPVANNSLLSSLLEEKKIWSINTKIKVHLKWNQAFIKFQKKNPGKNRGEFFESLIDNYLNK